MVLGVLVVPGGARVCWVSRGARGVFRDGMVYLEIAWYI